MKKRGQVTLYLIFGIVIVGVFIFILFLVSSMTSSKLTSEQRKVIIGVLEASAVNYYAQACLEGALKEGVQLLGEQGGYIYTDQGGFIERDDFGVLDENVSFSIKPFIYADSAAFPCSYADPEDPPDYCRYPKPQEYDYLFGDNNFPTLTGAVSFQNQLRLFIENKSQECLNELIENGTIAQQFGYQVTPGEEGPRATMIFSGSATAVKLDYPMRFQAGNQEPVTQFLYWDARVPVRLRILNEIINDVLNKDNTYIDFNISQDIYEEKFKDQDNLFYSYLGSVSFKREPRDNDDLFIFNDSLSNIDGKPYSFKIAKQNRPPALEWINNNFSLFDYYDYLVIRGEKINITMKAGDPDEDELSYSFSGDLGNVPGKNFVYPTSGDGYYNVTATVSDGVLADSQIVRILVDTLLKTNFTVKSPYLGFENEVSIEDPIYLDASSTTDSLDRGADFFYEWRLPSRWETVKKECTLLPSLENCTEIDYDFTIDNIKDRLSFYLGGANPSSVFTLRVYINYSDRMQIDSLSKTIPVRNCIPHRNPASPAYPFNSTDAFYANHTCCINFDYASTNTVCFVEEEELGNQVKYKKIITHNCSGNRGNICDGQDSTTYQCLTQGVHSSCINQTAYGLVSGGWCHGDAGCKDFCTSEIVDDGDIAGQVDPGDSCGCGWGDNNKPCDINFYGDFEGVCSGTWGQYSCAEP